MITGNVCVFKIFILKNHKKKNMSTTTINNRFQQFNMKDTHYKQIEN